MAERRRHRMWTLLDSACLVLFACFLLYLVVGGVEDGLFAGAATIMSLGPVGAVLLPALIVLAVLALLGLAWLQTYSGIRWTNSAALFTLIGANGLTFRDAPVPMYWLMLGALIKGLVLAGLLLYNHARDRRQAQHP